MTGGRGTVHPNRSVSEEHVLDFQVSWSVPVLGETRYFMGWVCKKPAGLTEEMTSVTWFSMYM